MKKPRHQQVHARIINKQSRLGLFPSHRVLEITNNPSQKSSMLEHNNKPHDARLGAIIKQVGTKSPKFLTAYTEHLDIRPCLQEFRNHS